MALLGFARPIFLEEIIMPLFLIVGIIKSSRNRPVKNVNLLGIYLIIQLVLTTTLTTDSSFDGLDKMTIWGLILLAFSNLIFEEINYTLGVIKLMWLYLACKTLYYVIIGGAELFKFADISYGAGRLLNLQTGLEGTASESQIDPNYFAFFSGVGFLLTVFYFYYYRNLNVNVSKGLKSITINFCIAAIGIIEFWFTIRGFSRGMMLAIFVALVVFLWKERSLKLLLLFIFSSIISALIFRDVVNMFLERWAVDDGGGGRYVIWNFVLNILFEGYDWIIGFGMNYPWWHRWQEDGGALLGTHNSWLSLFISTGLVGIFIITYLILSAMKSHYRGVSVLDKIKLFLLVYIILSYSSIEPLNGAFGWFFLALCISKSREIKNSFIYVT
jgi:hypothetical protein